MYMWPLWQWHASNRMGAQGQEPSLQEHQHLASLLPRGWLDYLVKMLPSITKQLSCPQRIFVCFVWGMVRSARYSVATNTNMYTYDNFILDEQHGQVRTGQVQVEDRWVWASQGQHMHACRHKAGPGKATLTTVLFVTVQQSFQKDSFCRNIQSCYQYIVWELWI